MTQADSVHSTPPTNTPILTAGLARQQRERERALKRLAKLRQKAFAEIERLLAFIDASDEYVMTEREDVDQDGEGEDAEPSLGSFDRMTDQSKSWRKCERDTDVYGWSDGVDIEQDDADYEDADPDENKQQPTEMGGAA